MKIDAEYLLGIVHQDHGMISEFGILLLQLLDQMLKEYFYDLGIGIALHQTEIYCSIGIQSNDQ